LNGLSDTVFTKVAHCKSAKEIWDKLQNIHEGDTKFKEAKLQTYRGHFEQLKMKEDEDIAAYFLRVDETMNAIIGFGEEIEEFVIVQKILRSLLMRFNSKISSLEEISDLDLISMDELHGIFTTYEMRTWNVPTLGHHHSAQIYDDQSSQMDVIVSTKVFERNCELHLALIIIFHHYEPFHTGWIWFHCIPTISMILTILSYKLIEITEEVILGTLLGGTSQCNISLELRGETL
jgi:hypothetical protein